MVRNISICMKLYMKSKLRLGHGASQVFGHPDILLRISSAGGEVASYHDAVQAAGQSIGLQAPKVHFPAPAVRMSAFGRTKRNMAKVRSTSSGGRRRFV